MSVIGDFHSGNKDKKWNHINISFVIPFELCFILEN